MLLRVAPLFLKDISTIQKKFYSEGQKIFTAKGPVNLRVPEGDDKERLVCDDCGFIRYINPLIVVGTVCVSPSNKILLCKRGIEPRRGFWTPPSGFMEANETLEQGAAREALEESGAVVKIQSLISVYNIPTFNQVHIWFYGKMESEKFSGGPESLEVKLVEFEDIKWDEMAFTSGVKALKYWHANRKLLENSSSTSTSSTLVETLTLR